VTPEALWSVGYEEQERIRVSRFDPDTLEVQVRSEPIRSYFHDAVINPLSRTVLGLRGLQSGAGGHRGRAVPIPLTAR